MVSSPYMSIADGHAWQRHSQLLPEVRDGFRHLPLTRSRFKVMCFLSIQRRQETHAPADFPDKMAGPCLTETSWHNSSRSLTAGVSASLVYRSRLEAPCCVIPTCPSHPQMTRHPVFPQGQDETPPVAKEETEATLKLQFSLFNKSL